MTVRPGVLLVLLLIARVTSAQPWRGEVYGVPFTAGGIGVAHPLTGGFYNPMHQFLDIDADGDQDLFMLDISDGSASFWRNTGTRTAPSFRAETPAFQLPPVFGWFRFADIDGDGRADLMTSGDSSNSLAIYRNTGTPQNPAFTLQNPAVRDSAGRLVLAETYSIGSFADMDADGDLDFFSLNSGLGTINHYENIGGPFLFRLAFRTDRYQNIQICVGCNGPGVAGPGRAGHLRADNPHGNGSMHFADLDADRDNDMLFGDNFDDGLFYYRNNGTPRAARLDSVTNRFPVGAPVLTAGFNQPTVVDLDGDGDLDLFVSVLHVSAQLDNFWYYRNDGDSAAFQYVFRTRNFLPTVDVGFQSAPCLVDIDADGDQDLFVGNLFGPRDAFAHVAFFRNTGSAAAPAFALEDTGYASSTTAYAYVPRFADIDADGDQDMFLGRFNGSVEFHRNIGTAQVPVHRREQSFFDSVAAGTYAAPELFDLDADGDLDLFVGRGNGRIVFYRNTGTPQAYRFVQESAAFLGVTVGANAKPQFADVDGDGDRDLVAGASDGKLFCWRNDGPPGNPLFTFLTDALVPVGAVQELVPFFADIDGDGDRDLVAGAYRGGLLFHRNLSIHAAAREGRDAVPGGVRLSQNYPNPFNPGTVIQYSVYSATWVRLAVYDVLGREVAVLVDGPVGPGEHAVRFDATTLASGFYLCRLQAGGMVLSRAMMLLR